ncbi:hypothetical protein J2851_002682 [Azospirillum rugosum]|uniref:Polyketide cyclase / dehydrase and lipid transport n=2 Tax=Azospirillum rugosum TaxID=416170 RepID=A0ABS4SK21_9PROT|nr:hypothetical protein [Azospirillum rugosum]MDQ0529347.1 hypothetical protein [Azospirillum rugosum]
MKALLPVSAPRLWSLVRWDGRLLDWYPDAVDLRVHGLHKGAHRHLHLRNGATLVHQLEHASRIEDAYTYSVVDGPYPVADYLAQIRVLPHGDDRATLVWTANFRPAGLSEGEAESFIQTLYRSGFDTLSTLLAGLAGPGGATTGAGPHTAPTLRP